MLTDRGSRRVPLSKIRISTSLPNATRRLFSSRPAFLKNIKIMTEEAIQLYITQHPPVVYEMKRLGSHTHLMCIGNIFPLYVAQRRFPGSEKIRVTLVDAPLSKDSEAIALSLALSAETCHALSPKGTPHYIVSLWQQLSISDHHELMALSEQFNNKTALCEALSINRRDV